MEINPAGQTNFSHQVNIETNDAVHAELASFLPEYASEGVKGANLLTPRDKAATVIALFSRQNKE